MFVLLCNFPSCVKRERVYEPVFMSAMNKLRVIVDASTRRLGNSRRNSWIKNSLDPQPSGRGKQGISVFIIQCGIFRNALRDYRRRHVIAREIDQRLAKCFARIIVRRILIKVKEFSRRLETRAKIRNDFMRVYLQIQKARKLVAASH